MPSRIEIAVFDQCVQRESAQALARLGVAQRRRDHSPGRRGRRLQRHSQHNGARPAARRRGVAHPRGRGRRHLRRPRHRRRHIVSTHQEAALAWADVWYYICARRRIGQNCAGGDIRVAMDELDQAVLDANRDHAALGEAPPEHREPSHGTAAGGTQPGAAPGRAWSGNAGVVGSGVDRAAGRRGRDFSREPPL